MSQSIFVVAVALSILTSIARAAEPPATQPIHIPGSTLQFSGVYPHMAYYNNEGECGTGAVVPWADRLWVITYGPHLPTGSSDKLYEINNTLAVTVRPESIGGTPANRMIHRESNQLFIGPYAIDKDRTVRVIPYGQMPGRHTGNARHLTDPAGKIYYATMEEGLYEVDVKTLDVTGFIRDGNFKKPFPREKRPAQIDSQLPGYHGKGFYSGQGRAVYANNGERGNIHDPTIPSGALAEWRGAGDWQMVRRNQFTEVTGPGGIYGNDKPETDPIWSIGWDFRSLILMVLDNGQWHAYRLPKGSHSYDGSHGWNTEWPRIREIGENDLLMTMHGTFWHFPRTFTATNSAGIAPRSNYIKVIGDFARWNDRLVFGCDDSAKSEFLNRRKAKGVLGGPGQSNSNLWIVEPARIDQLGPAIGRGAVWMNDAVKGGEWSDPYLFAGYDRRSAHLKHASTEAVTFEFEVDAKGNGQWQKLREVKVPAKGYAWIEFPEADKGAWVRVRADRDCEKATVFFSYANADRRTREADAIFNGIAKAGDNELVAGLVRGRGENLRTMNMAALTVKGATAEDAGYYELDGAMKLRRVEDAKAHDYVKKNAAIPQGVLSVDAASVLYVDDAGRRWRLPKGDAAFDALTGIGLLRIDREVCTERDLFNAHGTFYELPAENAGGFAKVRPVATHNRRIVDYCSYRGMLILTGIAGGEGNSHIVRSEDGKAAVWAGVVDDLWKLGKPVGVGGPWKDTAVKANKPSDPYLMTAYDAKKIALAHTSPQPVNIRVEIDITGAGDWIAYRTFELPANGSAEYQFPAAFSAYWLRVVADKDCTATAWLTYE